MWGSGAGTAGRGEGEVEARLAVKYGGGHKRGGGCPP